MDGKRYQKIENDKPIAKPNFPLPMAFNPSKRSELATQPQPGLRSNRGQKAHFYRQRTTDSGAPIYGFYLSESPAGVQESR
ncbi:MAG: hypothetical protein ABIO91_06380 [Pyrinomonadaceae bacterium]